MLYQMVLFSVTLRDPNYFSHPIFAILYHLSCLVVSADRDFKFGRQVDGSKC